MKIYLLLAATFALISVSGMTGSAFAGTPFVCNITQGDMLSVQLPAGEQLTIPKEIECNQQPIGIAISFGNCQVVGVAIDFLNAQFNPLDFTIDEIFTNLSLGNDEAHCTQSWIVTSVTGSTVELEQELWFNVPIVGGEFLPIDSTALLLASAQSFSWMIPVVLSGLGIGLFVVSRKA